jgi:hypothetical protein
MNYFKKILFISSVLLVSNHLHAQKKTTTIDSTAYYDELFNELDHFLDSLMAPRNMLIVNIGASNNIMNYTGSGNAAVRSYRKLNLTPSLGYYLKSGLGINTTATITPIKESLQAFQYTITGSYDYIRSMDFAAGISYTKIFTKDSLPFYTSPLENEGAVYFTYKNWWIRPTVSATYGWGTRSAVEERKEEIKALRLRTGGVTYINTTENVSDLSVAVSLRHDFYWRDKLGDKTLIRFTPQLTLNNGTQRFGFNQVSNSYAIPRGKSAVNVLYNSESLALDEQTKFQPLSLTAFMKTEFSWKNFYLQPQVAFDYYFPAKEKNLTTLFSINLGGNF